MSFTARTERRNGVEVVVLEGPASGRAEIVPAWGNTCATLDLGAPVLEPVPFDELAARPTSYGIPILFPFPNRARDGVLPFAGEAWHVDPPRHGFVRQRPWRLAACEADGGGASARSTFDAAEWGDEILGQFPFPFRLAVTWRLLERALEMETEVTASGDRALPFGFGIHPYFARPDHGTLTVPAGELWEVEDGLPTGRRIPVDPRRDLRGGADVARLDLDDVFTGLGAATGGDVRCILRDADARRDVVVSFDAGHFPEVVVYTAPPPRRAVCIEPYTGPTDLFRLAAEGIVDRLTVLEPGERRRYRIRIEVTETGDDPAI